MARVAVTRHAGANTQHLADQVIDEQPVALVYNGVSHVVMMATPLDLEDFALGFSLSEGLLTSLDELRDIEVQAGSLGVSVQLQVSPRAFDRFKDRRRQLAGRTGCGLCGIDSLESFHESLPTASSLVRTRQADPKAVWTTEAISHAFRALPPLQALQAQTGGCHAAAWGLPGQGIALVREDVGRHNALDKLIGALAREGALAPEGLALVSSRASHEMVSKCVRAGIGAMAAISAPTTLGIDLARRSGLRLFGFCRNDSAVEYA
ncbi:MAG TPA: formate dehydrogenase accessory sulfurtransferase FdhD [Candidatus Aquabacterium excrementipullorum]|nr:formate dehydrogenase accessory sulfurtransferase FdhD [Candidatus Aquabacterium excrementipullorum]